MGFVTFEGRRMCYLSICTMISPLPLLSTCNVPYVTFCNIYPHQCPQQVHTPMSTVEVTSMPTVEVTSMPTASTHINAHRMYPHQCPQLRPHEQHAQWERASKGVRFAGGYGGHLLQPAPETWQHRACVWNEWWWSDTFALAVQAAVLYSEHPRLENETPYVLSTHSTGS